MNRSFEPEETSCARSENGGYFNRRIQKGFAGVIHGPHSGPGLFFRRAANSEYIEVRIVLQEIAYAGTSTA